MLKKIILILTGLVLFSAGCAKSPAELPNKTSPDYNHRISIAGQWLNVEIANTDKAREQGLSGRPAMQDNQGMLFDFKNTDISRPSFWMKGMRFGLDLIWLKDFKIVGITAEVPPPAERGENLPLYSAPADIDMVLEVTAGWSEKHKIKIGETINFAGPINQPARQPP